MHTAEQHRREQLDTRDRDRDIAPETAAPRDGGARQLSGWIDSRTGLVSAGGAGLRWLVPAYVQRNVLYALGGLTLFSVGYQVFTGVCLAFYYAPGLESAYDSVDYITYQLPLGWLIRGIHHYNASALVILVCLHVLRAFFFGAYKKPREVTWLSGVALLLITLAFGFTGYLLPWDQKGYWASKVGAEIAAKVPLLGEDLARLMRGGPSLGQLTLTRFYVVHVLLLPGALIVFTALHLQQHRRHGVAPTIGRQGAVTAQRYVPYFPNWAATDVLLGLGLLALLIYLSGETRAPLDFPADPTDTNYDPKPEWYFLFLYQLLRYVPGSLEPILIVAVPLLVIGSMILLPFLDRGEERRPWRKPISTVIALFYIVVIVVFTLIAL